MIAGKLARSQHAGVPEGPFLSVERGLCCPRDVSEGPFLSVERGLCCARDVSELFQ